MIQASSISHAFSRDPLDGGGKLPVIDDVSLAIERGSFVSLLGPSGCGKTTLRRIMNGLLEYRRGELAIAARAPRAFTFPLLAPITASHHAVDEAGHLKDKRIEGKRDLLADEVRVYLAAHPAMKAGVAAE